MTPDTSQRDLPALAAVMDCASSSFVELPCRKNLSAPLPRISSWVSSSSGFGPRRGCVEKRLDGSVFPTFGARTIGRRRLRLFFLNFILAISREGFQELKERPFVLDPTSDIEHIILHTPYAQSKLRRAAPLSNEKQTARLGVALSDWLADPFIGVL
jgi:hypothetical protein